MSDRIKDRAVLITGASSGIGEATARLLSQAGAKTGLFARRAEKVARLAQELGGDALAIVGDVTSRSDLQSAVEQMKARFGQVDVLINNAGIMPLSAVAERRVEEWDRMIDVNLKGVLYAIDAVLPDMLARESGHIINISSVAGWKVAPTTTVYSATKFAVRAISEGLRIETAGKVKVTAIYPGVVGTELLEGIPGADIREMYGKMKDQFGMPASAIAEAICYALSQPSSVGVNDIIISPPAMA